MAGGRQSRNARASGAGRRLGARALAMPLGGAAGEGRTGTGTLAVGRPLLSGLLADVAARLRRDAAAEAASGRLVLWLPALFAAGIVLYFGAAREPSLAAVLSLAGALGAGALLARRQPVVLGLLLAAAALAAGFAAATLRTALIARPAFAAPDVPLRLTGHVERVEHRARADRILLRVDGREGRGPAPSLVRLSLRRDTAPAVGTRVSQLARLLPPLGPAMPGGYDFGRGPWFQGIDAVGFGLGAPKPVAATPPPLPVRLAVMVDEVRSGLAARVRAALSGVPAEIAIALVAGDRSTIPPEVEESMRVSGLTHILSISGLHMALVAGTLFALVRGLLALVPGLALGLPIKSLAAAAALAGSAFYLVLSGNDVPAQRSFVMTAIVLLGVFLGRPAMTLRTVAVAALVVLGLTPEAALEPGTQMSFAATLALVAAYERLRPLGARPRPEGVAARLAVGLLVFFGALALTSLVAGLATAPFGAFHFQRVAPYGLLANLAAMPAVSFLVMPFGLLGVLLMPFGWDGIAWPAMGAGIDWMVAVSDHVATLPGADGRFTLVGTASLAWASLALLGFCLLRGSLAFLALVPFVLALATAGPPPRPDLLIAPNGRTVAVRAPDGHLSVVNAGTGRLLAEQWMTREGDHRVAASPALDAAFACDTLGCVAPLPGGGTVAVSRRAESLEADCLESRIVVTIEMPPGDCPARVVTPEELRRTGTLALFREAGGWREVPTRPRGTERPWMPQLPPEPASHRPEGAGDTGEALDADAAGP